MNPMIKPPNKPDKIPNSAASFNESVLPLKTANIAIKTKHAAKHIENKNSFSINYFLDSIRRFSSAIANLPGVRFPFRYFLNDASGISKSKAAVFAFRFPCH